MEVQELREMHFCIKTVSNDEFITHQFKADCTRDHVVSSMAPHLTSSRVRVSLCSHGRPIDLKK